MSSNEELIQAYLQADSALAALLAGGFYAYSDTTRSGFSRVVTPNAYDQNTGLLKPLVVVKERANLPKLGSQGLTDEVGGYVSSRQAIELWFYQDGDGGYSIVQQARDRAYSLLQNKQVGNNVFQLIWVQDVNNLRDTELNEASLIRSDYALHGFKSA